MRASVPVRVLQVSSGLPHSVLDAVLSAAESALLAEGATRVWIDFGQAPLTVMAQFDPAPEAGDRAR